jgi:salicylate hydroxylase
VKPGSALIAGAGIGGISAALILSSLGWRCRLLERRLETSEAGAGIQIGPNGTRILLDLGVAPTLAATVGVPQTICVRDGRSGKLLSQPPLGAWIADRHGAPYWTAHRADLHAALIDTLRRSADANLTLGFEIARIDVTADRVSVTSGDGRHATADILIGADGVNSSVRRLTFGDFPLTSSGRTATRAVIANDTAIMQHLGKHVGVWLAPGAHVVHYPVRGGAEIALVVVTQDAAPLQGWNTAIDARSILSKLSGLTPELLAIVERATTWRQWSLVTTPRLPAWSRDRTTLLGDATQPILPFLAQGAVMAMEDAEALGRAISFASDYQTAFAAYDASRNARKLRVQNAAARNGTIYHLSGAMAAARNLTLRTMPADRLMASYDWLYGYRP